MDQPSSMTLEKILTIKTHVNFFGISYNYVYST